MEWKTETFQYRQNDLIIIDVTVIKGDGKSSRALTPEWNHF
jgi:hypothetical protein